jgi:hypothetical protein
MEDDQKTRDNANCKALCEVIENAIIDTSDDGAKIDAQIVLRPCFFTDVQIRNEMFSKIITMFGDMKMEQS